MSGTVPALLAGGAAGFGIAMPLGAIGVLIVHEGIVRGWRPASAAATGTALVDLGYVTLALAAGAAVADRLQAYTRTIQLLGAAVLLAVVARGLLALRRNAFPPTDGPGDLADPSVTGNALRTLRRFVALTAINPLTAVYFVALTAGLGSSTHGLTAAVAFAAGVFLASWSWQLILATIGALAGARLPAWTRTATSVTGYLVVLGYAAHLATG